MISVRMNLPRAHLKSSHQEDRDFQKKLSERVVARANRKQLGDRFVRVIPVVKAGSDVEPLAIDFEFTGSNHHGAGYAAEPFIQDLATELRAELDYPAVRVRKDDFED